LTRLAIAGRPTAANPTRKKDTTKKYQQQPLPGNGPRSGDAPPDPATITTGQTAESRSHSPAEPSSSVRAGEREIPHGEVAVAANGKGPCFGCRR
jgi:hypothetical protein